MYTMDIKGITPPTDPPSRGCWTPDIEGYHVAFVLCLDKHGQAFEYPEGAKCGERCNGNTAFKRVFRQKDFMVGGLP